MITLAQIRTLVKNAIAETVDLSDQKFSNRYFDKLIHDKRAELILAIDERKLSIPQSFYQIVTQPLEDETTPNGGIIKYCSIPEYIAIFKDMGICRVKNASNVPGAIKFFDKTNMVEFELGNNANSNYTLRGKYATRNNTLFVKSKATILSGVTYEILATTPTEVYGWTEESRYPLVGEYINMLVNGIRTDFVTRKATADSDAKNDSKDATNGKTGGQQ